MLLDFWASWCAPCRQVTPLLAKWCRLHSQELEIVSISLNDKVDDWRKAIDADKMEWPQINGDSKAYVLNPAEGSIPDLYHINLIPSLILLDMDLRVLDIFGGWYRAKSTSELDMNSVIYSNIEYGEDECTVVNKDSGYVDNEANYPELVGNRWSFPEKFGCQNKFRI